MHYDFPSLLQFAKNNPYLPPDWTQRPWGRPIIRIPSGNNPYLVAIITIRYAGIIIDGIRMYYRENIFNVYMPTKMFLKEPRQVIRFTNPVEKELLDHDIIWMYRYIKTGEINNGQEKLSRVHEDDRHSAPWA